MSSITFSGINTGMDTGAMISQLVGLERQKITNLQTRQSDYRSQLGIVQSINSKLQALQTKSNDYDSISEFLAFKTTTSDEDFVTATANGDASPGNYSIEVSQLAKAQRTYADPIAAKDQTGLVGTGTLTIQVGTEDAIDIEITAEDTLETIAGKINSTSAPVSASILSTGTDFRLQVSGLETGAENAISFTETGVTIGLTTNIETAQDALFTVDGFDVQNSSNSVTEAIQGVTFNLKDITTAPETISIAADQDSVKTRVKELVASYNAIVDILWNEARYDGEAKGSNRLVGDSTLRSLQTRLGRTIASEIEGLTGSYSALSQVGVTTGQNGRLEVDEDDLAEAISNDAVGVAQLFSGTANKSAEGIAQKFDTLVDEYIDYTDGALSAKTTGINDAISRIDHSIEQEEMRIEKFESRLRAQFTSMELIVGSLQSQMNYLSSSGI